MKSGSGEDAEGEECLVRLVENKSGSRVEWVLEMTGAERVAAESGPSTAQDHSLSRIILLRSG
jgi:hypothetical protein